MLLEAALADFSSDEAAALLENHAQQQQQQHEDIDRSLVQTGTSIAFSWDILQGKPPTATQSEYSGDVDVSSSSPDTSVIDRYSRHHHPGCSSSNGQQNQRVRYYSGELSPHHLQQQERHSGDLRSLTVGRQYSGELLPHSQYSQRHDQPSRVSGNAAAAAAAAAEGGSVAPFESRISAIHRERTSIGTSDASEPGFYRERGHSTSNSRFGSHFADPVGRREEQQDTGCSSLEEDVEDDMCEGEYEVVCTIPLEREAHQPNPDPSSSSGNRNHQLPPAAPASRLLIIRESDQGECSNFSSPRNGPFSPAGRRRSSGSQQIQQQQQQQMRLKVYPGDVIRISRMSSFQSSTNSPHRSADIDVEKFFQDESPVSTLEQLPSPSDSGHHRNHLPHRNHRLFHRDDSSASAHVISSSLEVPRGSSSSPSSRRGSAARPNSSASASPGTERRVWVEPSGASSSHEEEVQTNRGRALGCLPSFTSSSLHSSAPPISNSSSSNFLATCLVALELALRSEVEEDEDQIREEHEEEDRDNDEHSVEEDESGGISSRHDNEEEEGEEQDEEGFLSMEDSEGAEHLDLREITNSRRCSSEGPESHRRRTISHRWVSNAQFEPEYHTMDFFSESEDDSPSYSAYRMTSEATSSLQESEMCRFRDLRYHQRQRRRHSQDVRSDSDEYSWGDERFLQAVQHEGMNSWADDDLSIEFNNISGQHDDVFWDDQQSEMNLENLERAEEVIRGAVDGLRFTYSPVSSAFVFTRPETSGSSPYEANRQLQLTDHQIQEYSPSHTEGSQRFSISLDYATSGDYATSVCSEDSLPYSMTRSSYVTELGLSRAESWSRVQRGAASSEIGAQRYPSGLVDHGKEVDGGGRVGGGYAAVEEDSSGEIYESPENELMNEDQSGQLAPKRATKKSKLPTCLAFRSILKTLKAFSPRRSKLSPPCPRCQDHQQQSSTSNWSTGFQTPQMAVQVH